jgi:hypothetical protein
LTELQKKNQILEEEVGPLREEYKVKLLKKYEVELQKNKSLQAEMEEFENESSSDEYSD